MQTQWISVLVHPGSKREVLVQTSPGKLEAWIRAKPEQGQANIALTNLLARELQIPREQLRLVKGGFSRRKLFKVVG
jgi:uncharacterized protein YggU (UPF0235/DUF167 family)